MTTSQPTNAWDFATRMGQTIALAAVVCILGLGYLNKSSTDSDEGDAKPVVVESISKVLIQAYEADRKSKISILKGIANNSFPSDQAKLDWINSETDKKRAEDFETFKNRMAEAIDSGKTDEMAKQLEEGK